MAGRLLAFGSVLGLAAANGGWGAVSWGWAALALCWAAGMALVLAPVRPPAPQLWFLAGLTAFAAWTGASALWTQTVPATVLEVERDVVYLAGVGAAALLFRRGAEEGMLAAVAVVCAWNLLWRLHGYDSIVTGASAEPIGYANGLGLLAAIGTLLALRRPRTWPAVALTIPVLALAQSSGAWLALAAGLAVAWRPRLAPLVAVLAAVVVLAGLHGHQRSIYWDVAIADARAHPALGSGAGSYRQQWLLRRPEPLEARDAHSLYLEVLAELGPVGLVLLAGTLALPFVRPPAPGRGSLALGAYAAWVVQAGIDWQWELPAVTLAGLLCGAAALGGASDRVSLAPSERALGLAAAAAVFAFALVGLVGNSAVAAAQDALRRGDDASALASARRARTWAPWAAEPWRLASAARGGDPAALRRAIARDPHEWRLWAALRDAATGPERRRAAAKAARLNPLGANAPSG
ncbi:MAG TPA: O-antigen ligase family protein [Gaiellaceae bacterium]|jgi:hypothetical protein|nr:O-antigen ligase family protein [Gaiellaceae bacterium]